MLRMDPLPFKALEEGDATGISIYLLVFMRKDEGETDAVRVEKGSDSGINA